MTTQPTEGGKIGWTTVAHGYDTQETLPKLWNSLSKRVVTRKSWPLGPQGISAKAKSKRPSRFRLVTPCQTKEKASKAARNPPQLITSSSRCVWPLASSETPPPGPAHPPLASPPVLPWSGLLTSQHDLLQKDTPTELRKDAMTYECACWS